MPVTPVDEKRIDRLEDQSDEHSKDLRDIDREVAELAGEVRALRVGIEAHEKLDVQRHEEVKAGLSRVEKALADMRDASTGSTSTKGLGWKELGLLLGGIATALGGGVAAYQQMQQAPAAQPPAISAPAPSVGGGTGAANPAP